MEKAEDYPSRRFSLPSIQSLFGIPKNDQLEKPSSETNPTQRPGTVGSFPNSIPDASFAFGMEEEERSSRFNSLSSYASTQPEPSTPPLPPLSSSSLGSGQKEVERLRGSQIGGGVNGWVPGSSPEKGYSSQESQQAASSFRLYNYQPAYQPTSVDPYSTDHRRPEPPSTISPAIAPYSASPAPASTQPSAPYYPALSPASTLPEGVHQPSYNPAIPLAPSNVPPPPAVNQYSPMFRSGPQPNTSASESKSFSGPSWSGQEGIMSSGAPISGYDSSVQIMGYNPRRSSSAVHPGLDRAHSSGSGSEEFMTVPDDGRGSTSGSGSRSVSRATGNRLAEEVARRSSGESSNMARERNGSSDSSGSNGYPHPHAYRPYFIPQSASRTQSVPTVPSLPQFHYPPFPPGSRHPQYSLADSYPPPPPTSYRSYQPPFAFNNGPPPNPLDRPVSSHYQFIPYPTQPQPQSQPQTPNEDPSTAPYSVYPPYPTYHPPQPSSYRGWQPPSSHLPDPQPSPAILRHRSYPSENTPHNQISVLGLNQPYHPFFNQPQIAPIFPSNYAPVPSGPPAAGPPSSSSFPAGAHPYDPSHRRALFPPSQMQVESQMLLWGREDGNRPGASFPPPSESIRTGAGYEERPAMPIGWSSQAAAPGEGRLSGRESLAVKVERPALARSPSSASGGEGGFARLDEQNGSGKVPKGENPVARAGAEAERTEERKKGEGTAAVKACKYQCPYCLKRFNRPSSLRIHTYSHTGEKPFVCNYNRCGRQFSVQSNLKRHQKTHTRANAICGGGGAGESVDPSGPINGSPSSSGDDEASKAASKGDEPDDLDDPDELDDQGGK